MCPEEFCDDFFAPTPSPISVRGLLLYAAWNGLRVETRDFVCVVMHADTSCELFARPLKVQEKEGWIWRSHGAMNRMRTASRDFTDFLADVITGCIGLTRKNRNDVFLCTSQTIHELWVVSTTRSLVQNLPHWTGLEVTLRGQLSTIRGTQSSHTCGVLGIRIL